MKSNVPNVPHYRRDGMTIIDGIGDPLRIRVTQADVDKAVQRDNRACALANGVRSTGKRKKQDFIDASVGNGIVLIEKSDGYWHRYFLADADRKMIDAFDQLKYFRPGDYVLLPPSDSQKIGARKGGVSGTATRTGKARTVTSRVAAAKRTAPTRGRPDVTAILL